MDAEGGEQRGKGKESDEGKVEVEGEEEQEDYVQLSKSIRTDQHHITHEENQNNNDSSPAVNTPRKIVEQDVSQVKFLGVEVCSHLVPVLQKIWDKYGNVVEGHVVNSESLLTWALESIAKIITILEDYSERSLDDSQAKYINAILLDLQLMHFKLDWIVPFVEKVLTLHKSKGFLELEMTKTKLQTEFHQMEEKSTEQTKLVLQSHMTSTEETCPTLNLLSLLEMHKLPGIRSLKWRYQVRVSQYQLHFWRCVISLCLMGGSFCSLINVSQVISIQVLWSLVVVG